MSLYKYTVYFDAKAEEFDELADRIDDAATAVLGCTDKADHECPRFQGATWGPLEGNRRFLIRAALADLWDAARGINA